MMVASEKAIFKARGILEQMISLVEDASQSGERIDRVEREVFSQLLQLGLQLLSAFIKEAGGGDEGTTMERNGQTLRRFKRKQERVYRSIFGILKGRRFHQKRQQEKAHERATKRLGKGQVKTHKQMAYVGAVYTISPWIRTADDILDEMLRVRQKNKRPEPQNKRVWAEMTRYEEDERLEGQPQLFSGLAWEACHRNPHGDKPLVCLMDGQRSLWNMKDLWLSNAVGILDIFHAAEWIWKAAYCFHKEGSRDAEEFVTHYLRMLLHGKVGHAIGSLRRKQGQLNESKKKILEKVLRYLTNNRQYMRYDEYLRAGYPIDSGVVEGACRHLVRDRMEQTGMRWNVSGAQAMLNTRSIYINEQWDDFIEYRIMNEQDRLYAKAA